MVAAMRALASSLLLLVACGKESSSSSTGSAGSAGSGSTAPPPAASPGSAAPPAPAAPACDLAGNYRLRFHSNGTDGWWLRLAVAGKDVKLSGKLDMLGLDEEGAPTTVLDDKACTLKISKKTKQAGDLAIALEVKGDKVTGTVTRTANADDKLATSPITGLRETAPPKVPECIKPGAYELKVENVKKWTTEGSPGFGNCKTMADTAHTTVRVEILGDELYIDEVTRDAPYGQSFGRAELKRTGECEATFSLEVQDFHLMAAKVNFGGGKVNGKTTDFKYDVFEDGTAGENQWSCTTKDGDVVATRVGD